MPQNNQQQNQNMVIDDFYMGGIPENCSWIKSIICMYDENEIMIKPESIGVELFIESVEREIEKHPQMNPMVLEGQLKDLLKSNKNRKLNNSDAIVFCKNVYWLIKTGAIENYNLNGMQIQYEEIESKSAQVVNNNSKK